MGQGIALQSAVLPNYFNTLRNHDLEEFLDEEELFRARGFDVLSEDGINKCIEIA